MIYWGTGPDRFRSVFEKFGAVLSLQELQKPGIAWEVGRLNWSWFQSSDALYAWAICRLVLAGGRA